MVMGIAFFLIAAISMIMLIINGVNLDYITAGIAVAFIGVVMVYFSTNV
jgi:cell division protein FtsW (lipid II flippase)